MKIGLIGCGKMGSALLKGILKSNTDYQASVYDSYAASAESLSSACAGQVSIANDIEAVVASSEVILLCVKPNDVASALQASSQWSEKLLLSVAAGVTIQTLTENTQGAARVIRVMPNTPALIGEGASAFCCGESAGADDGQVAQALLGSVGTVSEVKESLMDAVTGLSGSGPAYVYTIIEALTDAGVKQGLARPVAMQLACQTLKGSAMLVEQSGMHPAELRDQVTSPGGTTIAGVAALEELGLRNALITAVDVATKRSAELG